LFKTEQKKDYQIYAGQQIAEYQGPRQTKPCRLSLLLLYHKNPGGSEKCKFSWTNSTPTVANLFAVSSRAVNMKNIHDLPVLA